MNSQISLYSSACSISARVTTRAMSTNMKSYLTHPCATMMMMTGYQPQTQHTEGRPTGLMQSYISYCRSSQDIELFKSSRLLIFISAN